MYLHGGTYSVSFVSGHWKLLGFLAEQCGCTVIAGSPANLPPIALFTGTADVLNPDAKKLRDLYAGIGLSIDYREYADMMHVWMLFDFPESKKARAEIITLVR